MNARLLLFALFIAWTSNFIQAQIQNPMSNIDNQTLKSTVSSLISKFPQANATDVTSGVEQVARFWNNSDGTKEEFAAFCRENYQPDETARKAVLEKVSRNMEILNGYNNLISLGLKEPLHMNRGPVSSIDQMFGGYEPASHVSEDFFKNKIAFFILLNFKFYSLSEKTAQGATWSREQWAMARLGELSKSRIPGELYLKFGDVNTQADSYISEYNIFMGNLINNKQEHLFPADMKLISHWGLRDELKANYNTPNGLEKQRMIYTVMNRIINQDIPSQVINSGKYNWNPLSNTVLANGTEIAVSPEPDTRYEWLLNNFKALKAMDAYNPFFPTYIQSKFESEMEIPQQDIEKLFIALVSSPEVKQVASVIKKRLGRKLEPFDIWYDGFKPRGGINQAELDQTIRIKYPDSKAFEKDIPNILMKLGFKPDKAAYIASKIQVDAARGSGHAWGAQMKGDKAHLRTRISESGMDYKGFNIAMHELGHNVEQTLTLYDIDHYLLNGVPNTAFTEALAFIFQKRDLDILGIKDNSPDKYDMMALDIFWSNYEIMGVSLVDMNVWKWLYQHPEANKHELKEAVIQIAKDVWNKYYADVFGIKDQAILAVYSHMIDNPLYLSAYPIGYLIDFQIEKQIQGKDFASEIMRIYGKGRIVPQLWMEAATGSEISNQSLLDAVVLALKNLKQ
ncbi:MAG: hypothetical protein Q8928_07960 [Bacteroidota bacterium]|nr:hypothetical protein [Bacteroidota bacterium]